MRDIQSGTPRRILHIIGRMDRAGAETMVMNLYREIDRSRFQFDFVYFTTDHCDFDEEIQALGGQIFRICTTTPVARFWLLHRLLRLGEWSIVHSHTLFSSGLHLTAARLAGVKHRIAHSHNTQHSGSRTASGSLYQQVTRWLLRQNSTRRAACGAAAAAYLFPNQDVVVIPNAIDIDRFAEAEGAAMRRELGIRDGQIVIVQVGRLMPVKNHVRSVSIARTMRDEGIDFVMLLAGTGPEQAYVERLLRQHGLNDRVHVLGLRTDIPQLMAAADVMLMPSTHEGFPVVLVEAQAAGLPSVVSSAVSPEVDLELGLVRFVSLDAPDMHWVNVIQAAANAAVPSPPERRIALEAAGFSSAAGAKRVEELYATA